MAVEKMVKTGNDVNSKTKCRFFTSLDPVIMNICKLIAFNLSKAVEITVKFQEKSREKKTLVKKNISSNLFRRQK